MENWRQKSKEVEGGRGDGGGSLIGDAATRKEDERKKERKHPWGGEEGSLCLQTGGQSPITCLVKYLLYLY